MDPDQYRQKLESDILAIIEQKLTAGEMDVERAKAIATMVLEKLHPPLTLEQIHQVAPTLDDEFKELSAAVLPVLKDHQEEVKQIVTSHALQLMQSGKFDMAHQVMKKATEAHYG